MLQHCTIHLLPWALLVTVPWMLTGCDDELPAPPSDIVIPDVCTLLCDDEDVTTTPDPGPPQVDTVRIDKDQCDLDWSFVNVSGGAPSHPLVDDTGIATIVAGSTLTRVTPDGTNATATCTAPFTSPGEILSTPAQARTGVFFLGTLSGKLLSVSAQCESRWNTSLDLYASACKLNSTSPLCNAEGAEIREAPALHNDDTIFVLDTRPALHRINDLGTQGDYKWPHLTEDTESLPDAAPIYVGTSDPFVAFPTRKTVVAVNATGSRRWLYKEPLDSDTNQMVVSPLAVDSDGAVLFVVGDVKADHFENLYLVKLLPNGTPSKAAIVAPGYPIAFPSVISLDTVHGLALGSDNSVYVGMALNGLMRMSAQGDVLWKFIGDEESLRVSSVPAVADDGSVFITAEPHLVYGIDKDGNRIFRYEPPAGGELETTSPVIRNDGSILVHLGTELKSWSCPNVTGLAASSWPRYQRNNRNGGNLQESE